MATVIVEPGIEYTSILSELGAETFVDAHKHSAPAHEIESYLAERYALPVIRKELTDPANTYAVIEYEGKTAGFSKLVIDSTHPSVMLAHTAKMDQIYLSKFFYGLKLGAALMKFNIKYSKTRRQNGMWLVVWTGNKHAIRFYERFGFEIIEEATFKLTATHINPCYIMLLDFSKNTPCL